MVPRTPRRVISRERLVRRIHGGIGSGITILHAPAGFGKTTLAGLLAADLDYETRWLTLDPSSGAPEVLSHQLGAALAGNPEAGPPATALKLSDLQAYLHASLLDAADSSDRPIMLVIDNVHELQESLEACALLAWLCDVLPESFEILLSGRELPFIPSINSRVATGDVVVLEGKDLAFDLDEVREVIEATQRTDLEPRDVLERTGGWPVGVMATVADGSSCGEGLSAAAFDAYLATEIWQKVPSELKPVLRQLSIRPTIERALVEMDYGVGAWRQLVGWLSSREFLWETLSPAEFRLNPLLKEHIAHEYDQEDPEGYALAVDALAAELVAAGDIAGAVEFARMAGNERQLASLLEQHSHLLIIQGSLTLLWRSFECMSQVTLQRRPLLRSLYARVLSHVGDPEEAMRKADKILMDATAPMEAKAHSLMARMRSLRLLGRHPELAETAGELESLDTTGDATLSCETVYQRAEVELSVTRNFARATELLELAIERAEAEGIEPLGLLARSTLGQALAMRGDAPAAVTVLTRAAKGWRGLGRSSNLGWVLNNLGMGHLDAGDFASAASVLQEAVQEGINCGNQRNVAYATASLGDAELALGHFQLAREHYEEAIRICATDALDETLAALSIAGLSSAFLGLGDLQQADFFSRRALLVAISSANDYELATCKLQHAAVEFAAGNYAATIANAAEAASLYETMDVPRSVAAAHYRVAMAHFKANRKQEAQESLLRCASVLSEPWMAGVLVPLVRENPMFAQWAASRPVAGAVLRDLLERQSFAVLAPAPEEGVAEAGRTRWPRVTARSLGVLSVAVGGRDVSDEQWASARAKEMFFLFLANRAGIRKEEAVEYLYPDLPREKCNSAFHSNLYRVRKALYQESVIKRDGTYVLNPEGTFEWDVEQFHEAIERGRTSPAGSRERAVAFQEALELYAGPFAEAFHSEWAEAQRARLEQEAHESLALLAGYFASRSDFESAAACMERVLRANAFNEEAAYELATFRSRAGHTVQALRFIDDYGARYEEELGEALPERFRKLRADIAAGIAV